MIFHRWGSINKNQAGFTLIEMLIGIAITGLICGGIVASIALLLNVNASSRYQMAAVPQVQNAGQWISQDAQMAHMVTLGESAGFPLILSWTEYNDTQHEVTYCITEGELIRSEDGNETLIAKYINPEGTNCVWDTASSELILTVTATVSPDSPNEHSETRVYRTMPRPD